MSKVAKEWLASQEEVAGLLGASWLLMTDQQDAAKAKLQKLQTSANRTLAKLAAVQLWRAVPPSETTGRMQKWLEARDSLSLPMQLGPSEFLADRFSRIDRPAWAIGEWLRIGALYPEHPHRAAVALDQAGQRLNRSTFKDKENQALSVQTWRKELLPPQ